MNCMNCGAFLTEADAEYCPHCGANVLIQKKLDHLSKYHYNLGLEKASIRDLSGAISCLKQSLSYNKRNIQARNLLGLVYFETGEVVAALSEWVISKNLQKTKNLASEYIDKLQANPNKLEAINETIKKYNHALVLCREGHDDMAAIQLKKLLSQNSKLIKGYHLLALIQIKEHDWSKARKTLRKAARIDKTNTTTLRFLKEVDERTGVSTRLGQAGKGLFHSDQDDRESDTLLGSDLAIPVPAQRERVRIPLFFSLALGFAAGAAALWFLVIPAIRQGIYQEANQQIVKYSESLASQSAELTKAQGEARESGNLADEISVQIEKERTRSETYEALLNAYFAMRQDNLDEAALEVQKVHVNMLSNTALSIYNTVADNTGVTGIEDSSGEAAQESGDEGGGDSYEDESYDDTGYDEGYDDNYEDESYDDSGYEDESYDEGYDEGYEDYDDGSYDDEEYYE